MGRPAGDPRPDRQGPARDRRMHRAVHQAERRADRRPLSARPRRQSDRPMARCDQGHVLAAVPEPGGAPFEILCGAVNPLWTLPGNFAAMKASEKDDAKLVADEHDFAMLLTGGESPTGVMPYALDW